MIFWKKIGGFLLIALTVGAILLLPETAFAKALADQVRDPVIVGLWKIVLGIVNVVAILGLIFIAIVNILRIQIETYNIRRMLPTLVIAIILANFSHLICRTLIDFAQIFTNFFIWDNALFQGGDINGWSVAQAFGFGTGITPSRQVENAAIMGGAGAASAVALNFLTGFALASGVGFLLIVLVALVVIAIPALLVFILAMMMYVRLYVIWFLVILSPLAFFALLFDPLKTVWGMWWNWFTKWLFLAPVGFFFLRLAVEIGAFKSGAIVTDLTDEPAGQTIGGLAIWIFALGMVFFALYVPFSLGSQVFGALKSLAARGAALGWRGANVGRKMAAHRLIKGGRAGGKPDPNSRRARFGRWLGRDYGKAWETYQADVEKESARATYSGGLTRHIASGGQPNEAWNPAEVELYKLEAASVEKATASKVLRMAGRLNLTRAEGLQGPERARVLAYRDRLAELASQGDADSAERLEEMFRNVDPDSLQGEDLSFYEDVGRRIPTISRRRVQTFAEGSERENIPETQSDVRLDQGVDVFFRMNDADLGNLKSQIDAALTSGDRPTMELLARTALSNTPEAKLKGMSDQELRENLVAAGHDAQNMVHMRASTAAPGGLSIGEARERGRVRVHHENHAATMGRDIHQAVGAINNARGSTGGAPMSVAEVQAAIDGTHTNPGEMAQIQQTLIPKYQDTLNKIPRYQLNEGAVRSHLRSTGIANPTAAQIATETAARRTQRNNIIRQHLTASAGDMRNLYQNYRNTGKYDKADVVDYQYADNIFSDFDSRAY